MAVRLGAFLHTFFRRQANLVSRLEDHLQFLCTTTNRMQQQRLRFWTLPAGGRQAHTLERRRPAVASRQSGTLLVPYSCVAGKLGTPDKSSAAERQELLWRQYLGVEPMVWSSECRTDKKSSSTTRTPDFIRHKRPSSKEEALWLNSFCKPDDGGDAQPAMLNAERGRRSGYQPTAKVARLQENSAAVPTVPECAQGYGTAQAVVELCEHGQLSRAVDALTLLAETRGSKRVSTSLLHKVIRRCGAEKNLALGRLLDDLTVKLGHRSNSFLGNQLLRMYARQGRLQEAMQVFKRVGKPSVFMWFSIISAHSEQGKPNRAVQLYKEMRRSSLEPPPDGHVFVAALQACARAEDVESGRQVHADVVESGIGDNCFVFNSLVDMYAKCGELEDARRVFDSLSTRTAVTWTAMINGYAEHGLGHQALALYASMEQQEGGGLIVADCVTFGCLLKACTSARALQQGRQLHSQIVERGLLSLEKGGVVLGTCLINMYAKCGELDDARRVFDSLTRRDAVTWNAMINGYAEHGLGQQALTLYARMEQEEGGLVQMEDNAATFGCLLKACTSIGALQQGRQLHSQILERGLMEGAAALGTCLINMYAKCDQLEDARSVFDSLLPTRRNAVIWTAMINGYAEHGLGPQALALYARMEQDGLVMLANRVTYVCLLKACTSAGALQQGRHLHSAIVERGLLLLEEGDDTVLGNCLVNMYAKCGQLDDARAVFDSLATRDAVTWNAMINGYGRNNEGRKATACFEEMVAAGVQPDAGTLTCLLVACSQEGLVSQGRRYFDALVTQHGLVPTPEHFICMVDLLGRAGHLSEAETVLRSAGCGNDAVGLRALLTACKTHGDIERGTRCFESLVELDPQSAAAYVLMANMYADAERWADVDRVERLRKLAGASKKPAVAGIEVNRRVHTFVVGEEVDGDISCKARSTNERLKEEGNHVPQTKLVLKPVSEKEKEDQLCGHAEKLALAFGLLNTPDGTPLLVTKNLRMCGDCHSATEVLSSVEKREIVVRDAYRVHRFQAGSCSCKGRH